MTAAEELRIRKNKGTIQNIKITSDKLEVIHKILKSNVSQVVKESVLKKLAGGDCSICGGIPTKMVTFDVSDDKQGATRLEKYCDSCIEKVYEREPVL
ncbi:MAG TPA: hypothetical protein VH415_08570 [Nitrososphaeraceae archaeon]|jgi:hypothetical protein